MTNSNETDEMPTPVQFDEQIADLTAKMNQVLDEWLADVPIDARMKM